MQVFKKFDPCIWRQKVGFEETYPMRKYIPEKCAALRRSATIYKVRS